MDWIRKTPFKNQLGFFDFYKGILMICIPVLHILNLWKASEGAWDASTLISKTSVVVVSFFVISGYGFRPTNMRKCLKKQCQQILLPYIYMAVACIAIIMLKNLVRGRALLVDVAPCVRGFLFSHTGSSSLFGKHIFEVSSGWFLWTLFLAWIILNTVFLLKDEKKIHAAVVCLGVLGMCLSLRSSWIWCIPQSLLAAVLLYIGYLIKTKKFFARVMPVKYIVLCALLFGVSLVFGASNMGSNYWKLGALDYLGTVAGTILLLKIYSYILMPGNLFTEVIMTIGRYSYWIVCLHGIDMIAINFENIIVHFQLPYVANVLLHMGLDALFIAAGCKVMLTVKKYKIKKSLYGGKKHD